MCGLESNPDQPNKEKKKTKEKQTADSPPQQGKDSRGFITHGLSDVPSRLRRSRSWGEKGLSEAYLHYYILNARTRADALRRMQNNNWERQNDGRTSILETAKYRSLGTAGPK